jgi:hypothetical protein
MGVLLIDDHLLRGALAGSPVRRVRDARRRGELATTELYYHRLCSSLARPDVAGRLSTPVARLDEATRRQFRRALVQLPEEILTIPIRDLSSRMAEIKEQFSVSTLVAEALASSEALDASIAVDRDDLGPRMSRAAESLGVSLRTYSP